MESIPSEVKYVYLYVHFSSVICLLAGRQELPPTCLFIYLLSAYASNLVAFVHHSSVLLIPISPSRRRFFSPPLKFNRALGGILTTPSHPFLFVFQSLHKQHPHTLLSRQLVKCRHGRFDQALAFGLEGFPLFHQFGIAGFGAFVDLGY